MKDFDIEKLERKNIHTLPDHFFETVQENVLNETVRKSIVAEPQRAKLNWWYAAAAAIALIFGGGYLYTEQPVQKENTEIATANPKSKAEVPSVLPTVEREEEAPEATAENKNLTLATEQHQTIAVAKSDKPAILKKSNIKSGTALQKEAPAQSAVVVAKPTEAMMDEVLSNFSLAEIKEVSKNTEQDVYLDLYN